MKSKKARVRPVQSAQPAQPRSSLQIVEGMVRELSRLQRLCEETATEIENEDSPSRRHQLAKLQQQYSVNLQKMLRPTMDAEVQLGLLLEKFDVEATWTRELIEMRSALEQIPRRVATQPLFSNLDPIDVEETIRKEVNAVIYMGYRDSAIKAGLPVEPPPDPCGKVD